MKIYFARHGETDWNVEKKIQGTTDVPLNEKGLAQAKQLAEKLVRENYQIDCVYTSPQLRAKVTAEKAAEALGVPCIPLQDLIEMDLGEWEGGNWPDIERDYGEVYHYWNSHRRYVTTPGGECYNDVLKRTFRALKYIEESNIKNVLIVSHSAIMLSLRCYLAGLCMDDETMLQFRTKNTEIVELEEEALQRAMKRFAEEEEGRK